jgi:CBS domain-containing protein
MATTVEQVLTRKGRQYWTVGSEASVQDAVAILTAHRIGAVLVCDESRLVGLLSERDCIRQVMSEQRSATETCVRDVMVRDLVCVSPGDSIDYCMSLMNNHRVRHLPVLNDGELCGVISIGDAVNAMLLEKEFLIEELEGYIAGSASVRPSAHYG